MWATFTAWIDSYSLPQHHEDDTIAWLRVLPLLALHAIFVAGVFVFELTWIDVGVALALYLMRMFAITAFFHRYFAHKAFKTDRWHQFLWAAIGTSATQRGPLWWAAHHRNHHRYADTDLDPHNAERSFWRSHIGWFLTHGNFPTRHDRIADFSRFPELVWLDRFDIVPPLLLAGIVYAIGWLLETYAPQLGTTALQLTFWGYLASTLILLHVTLCINSLAHRWGVRRFATDDGSRNCWPLALLTLGEGWHNNHHRYSGSARQGFVWWEIDISYYVLRVMQALGLVWDLKAVPAKVMAERR